MLLCYYYCFSVLFIHNILWLQELTPSIWAPEETADLEKYIDFHHRHPHCSTPRLNKDLPLEEGETAARLIDPELPDMSFTEVRYKPPPLPKDFIKSELGKDADIDEVSTVAMIHEHESVQSYTADHDDPWYNMSVKDHLEQSHCDGSHTTVKWKKKKPPPMSEFNRQLAWQMNMFGNYAGGAPPMTNAQVENIDKIALRDKSLLHPEMAQKRVSPWVQDYQWSRFTAAGEALNDYKKQNRNQSVDDALSTYLNETSAALKSQKLSQMKSMKQEKNSEAAVIALASIILSSGIDKFVNFSSGASASSASSASLMLPSGLSPSLPSIAGNEAGLIASESIDRASIDQQGEQKEIAEVLSFESPVKAQQESTSVIHLASIDESKEAVNMNPSKKRKCKKKQKKRKFFTSGEPNESSSDDDNLEDLEFLDDYDRMKRKIGGDVAAENITVQLQKLAVQASRAAKVKKKAVDTSLDFFEACDKLRVVKVITLLIAGKGDPNLVTSEEEPLFIHCLSRLLRMDQVTSSLHPEDKHYETSDRRKLQRILDSLVQYGADVNTDKGREGQRPVHLVAASNNTKVMQWLAALPKINLEALSPRDQWTPLIVTTRCAHIQMMAMLLRLGVNLDAVDARCYTALHHAAFLGHTRAALFLLRIGANKMLRTVEGKTAASLAQDGNFLACSQAIASYAVPIISPADQLQHLIDLETVKEKKNTIQLRELGGLLSKSLVSGYDTVSSGSGYYWKQFRKLFRSWWNGDAQVEAAEDDDAFLRELQAAEDSVSQEINLDTGAADAVVPF